jgi:asparagine N-glycosylation enzyme membrane subunit Stt3
MWPLDASQPGSDRLTLAGVAAAILGFLAFCLYCKTVPVRVAAYMAAPLAFLAGLMTGSVLSIRMLAPVRPFIDVLFTVFVAVILWKSEVSQPLSPGADWRGLGP